LRGGEPIEFPHEFQMQANSITFTDINVSLYHALPPALRQFEKRYDPPFPSGILPSFSSSLSFRGLYVPMVCLKNVNGYSNFHSAMSPPTVGSHPNRTPVAPSHTKSDDLDSSTRSKSNSTLTSEKAIKSLSTETKEDISSSSMDQSTGRERRDQSRRPSNTISSPSPPPPHSNSPAQENTRRRSLKEYLHDLKPQKKLPHNVAIDRDDELSFSSSPKIDSDDLSDIKTPAGVWTEVSSVSSESEMESLRSLQNAEANLSAEHLHYLQQDGSPVMQWNTWLAERFDVEQQSFSRVRSHLDTVSTHLQHHTPTPVSTLHHNGEQSKEDTCLELSSDTNCESDTDQERKGNRISDQDDSHTQIANSPHPSHVFKCDSNSIPFTSAEVDDYTKQLIRQLLIRAQRWCWDCLQWSEDYLNHFIHTSQRFSGIPTCVVVYRLERILLYEMLKDNTGERFTTHTASHLT
jgi:hypothetical protein